MENVALVLDLVEWIAREPRPYREVMEAWRTSCPRLPVWEDAVGGGLLCEARGDGNGRIIRVTPTGEEFLRAHGRGIARPTPLKTDV